MAESPSKVDRKQSPNTDVCEVQAMKAERERERERGRRKKKTEEEEEEEAEELPIPLPTPGSTLRLSLVVRLATSFGGICSE